MPVKCDKRKNITEAYKLLIRADNLPQNANEVYREENRKEVKNFRIAGEDGKFHPATATVTKDKIYVFSPKVEKPQIVQYCFDNTSATEIFTQEGLPMSSFRMYVK